MVCGRRSSSGARPFSGPLAGLIEREQLTDEGAAIAFTDGASIARPSPPWMATIRSSMPPLVRPVHREGAWDGIRVRFQPGFDSALSVPITAIQAGILNGLGKVLGANPPVRATFRI